MREEQSQPATSCAFGYSFFLLAFCLLSTPLSVLVSLLSQSRSRNTSRMGGREREKGSSESPEDSSADDMRREGLQIVRQPVRERLKYIQVSMETIWMLCAHTVSHFLSRRQVEEHNIHSTHTHTALYILQTMLHWARKWGEKSKKRDVLTKGERKGGNVQRSRKERESTAFHPRPTTTLP